MAELCGSQVGNCVEESTVRARSKENEDWQYSKTRHEEAEVYGVSASPETATRKPLNQ